nr:beta-amylase 7-like [Coffea arabica]
MKEAGGAGDQRSSSGGGGGGSMRSAVEKERTKLRERQRRSITTKIFHGLRKHGGYPLSPRADINQVLRHLAQEAGWIVEPDGTTYRSSSSASTITTTSNVCPLCGNSKKSSFMGSATIGECSTTASPSRLTTAGDSLSKPTTTTTDIYRDHHSLVATYMCGGGGERGGGAHYMTAGAGENKQGQEQVAAAWSPSTYMEVQWMEARASNQNTPAGSPRRRT